MLDGGLLDGLSTEQLIDLRHRLNQTDESTTVLVPVGPKAFRLATLRLDQLYWGTKNHLQDDDNVGISKAQALQVLQDAISQRLPEKKVVEESEDNAGEHDEAATKSAETKDPGSSSTHKMSSARPSSMPFIDIREEVDEDGKPIRTEAIDLTDHLQHLIERTQPTPPAAGSAGPTDPQDEPAETDIDSGPRPMDGNEFEKLAARLDELALLEEAAAGDDDVPSKKASRTTLKDRLATEQGATASSSSSSSSAVTQTKKATKSGWSKGFLNNKPKSKQPAKPKKTVSTTNTPTKPTTSATTTKSVSFGSTPDQVHEIPPREEGHRRPVPAADPAVSLRQSRPIEPELFTGVVQERPRRKPSANAPAKEKKLSKFAQERQQGLL